MSKPTHEQVLSQYAKEATMYNDSKNVLTSKTAWVFVLLLIAAALKITGVVDFEFEGDEAEGIAMGVVAIIGIALRLMSKQRVHILPMSVKNSKYFNKFGGRK